MPRLLPSLKVRIALITTVLAAVLGGGIVMGSLYYAHRDLEDALQNQQDSIVKLSADQLDTAMEDRIVMLAHLAPQLREPLGRAAHLAPDVLREQLRDTVARTVPVPSAFEAVMVADVHGTMLTMDGMPADVSDRHYFREAARTRNVVVAAPLRARTDGSRGVLVVVPVLGEAGTFMGLVGGWLNLDHPNFLVEIGHSRLGTTGFYCLVSAGAAPVYVQHPDPARAQQPARPFGDTCGVDDSASALEFLTPTRPVIARRLMATTGWELVAVLPAQEAYGPLRQMQQRFLMMSGIVLAVVALLIWLAVRQLLMPLSRLHQVVRASSSDVDAFERLPRRPQRDEIGDVTRAFIRLMRDVRERSRQLSRSERRLRAVTDTFPALLAFIDTDERYIFNNLAYERAFGIPVDRVRGMTVRELLGEERYLRARPYLQQALAGGVVSFEGEYLFPNHHWMETSYRPEWSEDGAQVVGVHIHVQDITERKLETLRLSHISRTDHLTQLQNRAAFESHLRDAMALSRAEHRLMALLYLDMDRFKAVNDAHGHATGDLLLQAFALRLRRCVREQDHVARLGGDEFAVILSDIGSAESAQRVAEAILESVGRQFYFDGILADVDVSIGVALYRGALLSEEALMRMADVLLYRAKAMGRGRFEMGPAELVAVEA
ncbi:diguanylate cyclase domain-containing protein [Cupriavidus agavae]|uniref:PAS domain S-box-containing protein/diguanylate cyclase (GGDEF)-like protein n=1 Tax=Cupriavidus agavae TaxID=1001822 RepID=A0A4Q7RBG9_9BURK|nr:diguanylate cyclase [Cupriavidus agavae]RZT28992.1 PAS domain S-box-containing protein/diguanylate cyclase (GGDEF)-like protein [Cupriavidus agavae]